MQRMVEDEKKKRKHEANRVKAAENEAEEMEKESEEKILAMQRDSPTTCTTRLLMMCLS